MIEHGCRSVESDKPRFQLTICFGRGMNEVEESEGVSPTGIGLASSDAGEVLLQGLERLLHPPLYLLRVDKRLPFPSHGRGMLMVSSRRLALA